MLHPSPLSSEMMVGLMTSLGDVGKLVAPDTPGYGMSDALDERSLSSSDNLDPYVAWLDDFAVAMGFDEFGLYGTATGAQISIEYAKAHPTRLRYSILDNVVHFEQREREEIAASYFPDLSPTLDGSHLARAWEMSTGLFKWFPWNSKDEAHRISDVEPDVDAVQATVLATLTAGKRYDEAYSRAFKNENANNILEIGVPVHIIRWEGSILSRYAARLDEFSWPDNVQMHHCAKDSDSRFNEIRRIVRRYSNSH